MNKFKEIINGILDIKDELRLSSLTDDMILDCATRIYNSQNISEQRTHQDHTSPKGNLSPTARLYSPIQKKTPATEKQLYFLRRNKIPFSDQITKSEASEKIEEFKKLND